MNIEIPPFLLQQVQEAKAVLFLGAGASLDAADDHGNHPPTGAQLGSALADKFLGGRFHTSPLPQIAEYAISESDLGSVQEFIRETFEPFRPSAAHLLIPRLAWAGIATTNYDRLIELAYEQAGGLMQIPQVFVENGDRIEDKMRDPRSVKLLKLHGCITRLNSPNAPFILTTDQYLTHRRGRSRLFDQLKDWAYERTILFVGHSLQDPNIRNILLELAGLAENRPRYYLVAPFKDEIEKRFWETKKVSVIGANCRQFFSELHSQLAGRLPAIPQPQSTSEHEILARKEFTGVSFSRNCLQFLSADVDCVSGVVRTEHLDPKEFYKGYNRDWSAIEQGLDIRREMMDTVLLDHFLVDEHERTPGFSWVLIKAHAGAGKSVLLRRIAWEAAKDYDCLCLYLKAAGRLNNAAIQEIADVAKEHLYLFIDDVGERLRDVQDLARQVEHSRAGVTIVTAERLNEWNVVGSGCSHLVTDEYELQYLSQKEIKDLLKLLRTYRALGKLEGKAEEQQEMAFRELAGRQLLVALHEATYGKKFEDIIANEYLNIVPREAQQVYLSICVLNRLAVPVRAGVISRLHNIRFAEFQERFFKPLEHVVFTREDAITHDFVYVARHPVIADIVFWRALPDQEERFDLYVKCLSALNIDYASDRKAFRQMVRGKTLNEMFSNPELVRTIYDKMSAAVGDDTYLLHQRGIYEMNRGNHRKADEFLARASELAPYDTTIKHSMSELLLRIAHLARTPLEKEKLLGEASQLAQSIRSSRNGQSHAHHTLIKVGIERLKDLLAGGEDAKAPIEIEREVKSIEQTLTDGLQQFPDDPFLLSAEADFAEILKDQVRVTESLSQAFDKNPRAGYLAIRLSRQFERAGQPEKCEQILRRALDANRNDKALHFRLAQHLMARGDSQPDELVYHLERAFSPGDTNYQAQILLGRQLYIGNDRDRSREVFRRLKLAKVAPDVRNALRYPLEGIFRGSIARLDSNFAWITLDGSSELVYSHRCNMEERDWRSLTYGSRVRFRVAFNFHGVSASEIKLDGLL